jgi:hypothetical protein
MSTHPQRPQHNALGILATPRARTFPPGLRSTQPIPLVLSPSIQLSISRPDPGSSSGSPSSQGGSDGVLLYLPPTRFRRLRCVRTESARVWVWDLRVGPRTRSGARTTASPSCHHERSSGQGKGEEAGREVRTCYGQGRPMTPVVNRLARRSLVLPYKYNVTSLPRTAIFPPQRTHKPAKPSLELVERSPPSWPPTSTFPGSPCSH